MSVCNVCDRVKRLASSVPLASAAGRRRPLCRIPSLPSAGRRSLWDWPRENIATPVGGVPVARVPEKAYMFEMSLTQ